MINPITDMRRNLHRGKNVPLLDIKTDDPDPSYLRIAVLTEFNGVEWTSGSRSIVSDQLAERPGTARGPAAREQRRCCTTTTTR